MGLKRRWLAFCRRAGAKPGGVAGQGGPPEAGAAGRKAEADAEAADAEAADAEAADAEAAFAELDRRYREPWRHYHTWRHVAACLRELRRARPAAGDAPALELAVWFHDAVYEPGREGNEEASAELALRWTEALGLAPELGRRAARLILATRHLQPGPAGGRAPQPSPAAPRGDPAEALLRDIDLAVLGAGRARYRRYERGIAWEYSGLPAGSFREGRARLLRGFLALPDLYATPGFCRRLERRARGNLARALARLESGRFASRRLAFRSRGPGGRPGPR